MINLKEALIGKHNINKTSQLVFDKKYIVCGTIVMFSDNTFAVYVDGEVAKILSEEEGWTEKSYFIAYANTRNEEMCYQSFKGYTEDLRDPEFGFDIVRIYKKRLSDDDILKIVDKLLFAKYIRREIKNIDYIERK